MKQYRYAIEKKTQEGWINLSEIECNLKPFFFDLVEAVKMFDLYIDLATEEGLSGTVRLVRISEKPSVVWSAVIL